MSLTKRLTLPVAGLVLVSLLSGCGSGGHSGPDPVISVSVAPSSATVQVGGAQVITATVRNDSAQMGVSWTISPATGAGTLTAMSGTSVTYQAPASSPASDLIVTITATSVANHSSVATSTITVPAQIGPPVIAVTITPDSAQVDAGTTLSLSATVQNDPSQAGVSWTISPASGAGELSDATGSSVTYRAPTSAPASDVAVTITATAVADRVTSATATVVVPAIVVSIDPGSATVLAGQSQTLTATVLHDPSHAGVTWSISPETGNGTLRDKTDSSVTYDAPTSPVSETIRVTVTATAVSDLMITFAATITVPAIVVRKIDPGSALMPANGVQAFQAVADFDPDDRGVSWNLTQAGSACSPACGSLSSVDPFNATFTAPSAVAADAAVTLTATSLTDATKSASATIALSTGTVQLAPAELHFRDTKASSAGTWKRTLRTKLTNVSNVALDVAGMSVTGPNRVHFSALGDCGSRVAAGGSCNIDVTFAPKVVGLFHAELSIDDSSSDSPQRIPLSGRGCPTLKPCTPIAAIRSAVATTATLAVPAPTGPETVGTYIVDLVDRTHDDPYLANGTKRELLVRFWYPAYVKSGCKPAPYAAPAVWNYLFELVGVSPPAVRTNSCMEARILDGAHPVVVFTHGYTGTFTDYTFLFEDLASRGYVVASIGHTYESTAVSFPNGRFAKSTLGTFLTTARTDEQTLSFAESVRLTDVRFVVDELGRLNSGHDSPFAGHLDTASIAIAGHSLGGLTALQAMQKDSRIRAAVILDGVAADQEAGLTDTPVLILDAGREQWSADDRQLWNRLRGPRFAINLKDAAHAAPSDLIWLAKGAVETGGMTPEQTVAAIRDYVAAFLDASLQGKPVDRLLTRPSEKYPYVELTRPTP